MVKGGFNKIVADIFILKSKDAAFKKITEHHQGKDLLPPVQVNAWKARFEIFLTLSLVLRHNPWA